MYNILSLYDFYTISTPAEEIITSDSFPFVSYLKKNFLDNGEYW